MIVRLQILGCILFIGLSCLSGWAADPQPQQLFDGRTLQGWEGDDRHWRIEKGAIVGEIPVGESLKKNTWLVWRGGQLTDFDLRLQVKLSGKPAANSGIQFRCQVRDVDHVSGYQADLDMGATWLGRIYDEHGRALLVERGTRVSIDETGKRREAAFAPANQFAVLFRENAWNDYRIVAIGERIAVYINGTLFSELVDRQTAERDLSGSLAFQLHSGPETRVEFRDIRLTELSSDDPRLDELAGMPRAERSQQEASSSKNAKENFGFESGDLRGWTASGDAFQGQPISQDGISARWPGQTSGKAGRFFIGGYELAKDAAKGTLTSGPVPVRHPFASFLIGGGDSRQTRVEILAKGEGGQEDQVVFSAVGQNREQMRREVVDLSQFQGRKIVVRLVDDSDGPWGHLNFDDFAFHEQRPEFAEAQSAWRSTDNPLLHHLVSNPVGAIARKKTGGDTLTQMHVPPGFSVDLVAAEPELHQPMAFTFDARGRLWVVEGHSYPQRRPEGEGVDRILIFADQDGDGSYETRKVFIEGLNLVSGMQVGYGGVWVGAAPYLMFIPDANGDDLPDGEPQVLLDGFGYADTHETLNSFVWGPDGWLYGNQGVFNESNIGKPGTAASERIPLHAGVWRYHPTRHEFEVFAHGGSNQWGLDFDEYGQLFMTHCRSAWGKGATTHVVQGGYYWNQVNAGYAPFISSKPIAGLAHMKNYLLASARYGHGEGGAGKPGSRQVYGGHSHVGTMIYLGDNWPGEYRNHLFTHNLHGHQLNHQVNQREHGGYNTVHAGYDVLFCADRQYIGVDLQYGPDGAVYISDWYDPRHCHSPHAEQWDRGNGRLYRMKHDAGYRPVPVDYTRASDLELVQAQLHHNDWHVRVARRQLAERAAGRSIDEEARARLASLVVEHPQASRRLRALWAIHAIGDVDRELVGKLFQDESEYVRAWAVQLATESLDAPDLESSLQPLLEREGSLMVRRYLASATQRVEPALAWSILQRLVSQPENAQDRELPGLIWFGLAKWMRQDLEQALELAESTAVPSIADYVHWYAPQISEAGRDAIAGYLAQAKSDKQVRLLSLFSASLSGRRGLEKPAAWTEVSEKLYDSEDPGVRRAAESVGAALGDERLFDRMRGILVDSTQDLRARQHALAMLAYDASPKSVPGFLAVLDAPQLAQRASQLLRQHGDRAIAVALVNRLPDWQGRLSDTALETLCSRVAWAHHLLDAIESKKVEEGRLTAFYVRQMLSLENEELNERLRRQWGQLGQSSAERKAQITQVVQEYRQAPLWAYDQRAGAVHFQKLCANCHVEAPGQPRIGPKLEGTGAKGVEYIAENIIDPNAVVGKTFQTQVILTVEGRVLTGVVVQETESALSVRTATTTETVAKDDIEAMKTSPNSLMPEGLLDSLKEREKIELFKYLMSLK